MKVSFFTDNYSIGVDYTKRQYCNFVLDLTEEEVKKLNDGYDFKIENPEKTGLLILLADEVRLKEDLEGSIKNLEDALVDLEDEEQIEKINADITDVKARLETSIKRIEEITEQSKTGTIEFYKGEKYELAQREKQAALEKSQEVGKIVLSKDEILKILGNLKLKKDGLILVSENTEEVDAEIAYYQELYKNTI